MIVIPILIVIAIATLLFATPEVMKQIFKIANWSIGMPIAVACVVWVAATATEYFGRPAVEQIERQMIDQQAHQKKLDEQRARDEAAIQRRREEAISEASAQLAHARAETEKAIAKANADLAQARAERDAALTEAGKANMKVFAYEQAQQQHAAVLAAQRKRDAMAANGKWDDYTNPLFTLSYPQNWRLAPYEQEANASLDDVQGTVFHPDDDPSISIEAHGWYGKCGYNYSDDTLNHWYFDQVNYVKQHDGKVVSLNKEAHSYRVVGRYADRISQQYVMIETGQWGNMYGPVYARCIHVGILNVNYPADRTDLTNAVNQMISSMGLQPSR